MIHLLLCGNSFSQVIWDGMRRVMGDNGKLFISMYHYTRDLKHSRYPEIKGLNASLFLKQMDFFRDNCKKATDVDSVAELAVFLMTDKAQSITGTTLHVDNGTI